MGNYKTYNRKRGRSKQIIALMLVLLMSLGQMAIALATNGGIDLFGDGGDAQTTGDAAAELPYATPTSAGIDLTMDPGLIGGFIGEDDASEGALTMDALLEEAGLLGGGGADAQEGIMDALGAAAGTLGGTLTPPQLTNGQWHYDETARLAFFYSLENKGQEIINPSDPLQHGDHVILTFAVNEHGASGALAPGEQILVELPVYISSFRNSVFEQQINNLIASGILAAGSGLDATNPHVLRIIIGEALDGQYLEAFGGIAVQFELVVDLTYYEGEGGDTIKFSIGGFTYVTGGISTGGSTHWGDQDYWISKFPRGNIITEGTGADQITYIEDKTKPVPFEINFKLPKIGTAEYVDLIDTMSAYLTLCDRSTGELYAPGMDLNRIFTIYKMTDDGSSIESQISFNAANPAVRLEVNTALDDGSPLHGFRIRFGDGAYEFPTGYYRIVYSTMLTPQTYNGPISNGVQLTYMGVIKTTDEVQIISSNVDVYLTSKRAIVNGAEVEVVKVDEDNKRITFELRVRQIGDNLAPKPAGFFVVSDELAAPFTFIGGSARYLTENNVEVTGADLDSFPFILNQSPSDAQQLIVSKRTDNSTRIKAGMYKIRFDVDVDLDLLPPGKQVQNAIQGSIVIIPRDAKLIINKVWQDWDISKTKDDVYFVLYNEYNQEVARSQVISATSLATDSVTILLSHKDHTNIIYDGRFHRYRLVEEGVTADSSYTAAEDAILWIKKTDTEIVFENGANNENILWKADGIVEATFTNTPDDGEGRIDFSKYGKDNSSIQRYKLDDATFVLYRVAARNDYGTTSPVTLYRMSDGVYTADPAKAAGATGSTTFTTKNGDVRIQNVPYGWYFIKETSAPTGYLKQPNDNNAALIGSTETFRLHKFVDASAYTWKYYTDSMTNKKFEDGSVQIKKVDVADANRVYADVYFELEKYSDIIKAFEQVAIEKTDAAGLAKFTGLTEGLYRLSERGRLLGDLEYYTGNVYFNITLPASDDPNDIVAQQGTVSLAGSSWNAATLEGQTITITWQNKMKLGDIELLKYDADAFGPGNTKIGIKGAEFTIYHADAVGNKIEDGWSQVQTSNDDGIVKFEKLEYGYYVIYETDIPEGYQARASGDKQTIFLNQARVQYDWDNPQLQGKLIVKKTGDDPADASKKINLAGAEFELFKPSATGGYVSLGSQKTNANGEITFSPLLAGTYYIRENSAPPGYAMATGNGEYIEFKIGEKLNNQLVFEVTKAFHNNIILKDVRIKKLDEEKNTPLQGVEFKLTGTTTPVAPGVPGVTITRYATTELDGIATFANLPYGVYTITEFKGYGNYPFVMSGESHTLTIDANYTTNTLVHTFENTPIRLIVEKYDNATSGTGKLYLSGAEFIIHAPGGQYVVASGDDGVYTYTGLTANRADATRFTTSDASENLGKFVVSYVPESATNYRLEETKAPKEYALPTGNAVFTDFTIDGKAAVKTVEISNSKIRGSLKIVKDDKNGKRLPDITFLITGPNGYSKTVKTNEHGEVTVTDLLFGTYTITEQLPLPEGYDLVGPVYADIASEGVEVLKEIENPFLTGDLLLHKYVYVGTDENGEPVMRDLQGAWFKLSLVDGSPEYVAASDVDGLVEFNDIPQGLYTLEEFIAPYGYELDPTVWYTYIGLKGQELADKRQELEDQGKNVSPWFDASQLKQWPNDPIVGSLELRKVGEKGQSLAGATFTLYLVDAAGRHTVSLNEAVPGQYSYAAIDDPALGTTEFTTNNAGVATITNLPYGKYEIVEKTAPDAYERDDEPKVVYVVDENKQATYTFKNTPKSGGVRVVKEDISTGDRLFGAVIGIYTRIEGDQTPALYESETPVETIVTGYDGTGEKDGLALGDYVAIEEHAPTGYTLGNDRIRTFTLDVNNISQLIELRTFRNAMALYKLKIQKVDQDGVPLPGAEIKVTNKTGWGKTYTSDANGLVEISDLSAGTYEVEEIKAPDGYVLDSKKYPVTLDESNPSAEVTVKLTNTFILGKVELIKWDEDDKQLEGAVFELLDGNGNVCKLTQVAPGEYELDASGSVTEFEAGKVTIGKLPAGKYAFREKTPPTNYRIPKDASGKVMDTYAFTIDESSITKTVAVKAQNLPVMAGVAIRKVDSSNTNLALPGAVFTLHRSKDNGGTYTELAQTQTSSDTGYVIFRNLDPGYYQITETKPPAGYQAWPATLKFQVKSDGSLDAGTFTQYFAQDGDLLSAPVLNPKVEKQFRLRKVDASTQGNLSGAVFLLSGNGVSHTLTTGSDGYSATITLNPGTYTLTETTAPTGYALVSGSSTVVVTDTGITVDGAMLANNAPYTFTATNSKNNYSVVLYKTSSGSASTLGGAVFSVTPRSGGTSTTLTTASNGQSNVVTLTPGTYDIVETTAPSGYLRPLSGWTVYVSESGVATVSGSGISTWKSGTVIVINIVNTPTTTPTPTPTPTRTPTTTPSGGGGGGSTTSRTPTPDAAIPLGPGLPQTGELTNTQALILGVSMMMLSLVALLLFVALGGKREEDMDILPALI